MWTTWDGLLADVLHCETYTGENELCSKPINNVFFQKQTYLYLSICLFSQGKSVVGPPGPPGPAGPPGPVQVRPSVMFVLRWLATTLHDKQAL